MKPRKKPEETNTEGERRPLWLSVVLIVALLIALMGLGLLAIYLDTLWFVDVENAPLSPYKRDRP